jgi:hypothetical protein
MTRYRFLMHLGIWLLFLVSLVLALRVLKGL